MGVRGSEPRESRQTPRRLTTFIYIPLCINLTLSLTLNLTLPLTLHLKLPPPLVIPAHTQPHTSAHALARTNLKEIVLSDSQGFQGPQLLTLRKRLLSAMAASAVLLL